MIPPLMTRILYLAPVEWGSVRQRPQQLASRLARHFDVRYVEPVGLRSARLADLRRIVRSAKPSRNMPESVPVIRPRYFPILGYGAIDRANRRWLLRQLSRQFDFDGEPWILWLTTPSLLAEILLERTAPSLVVYDCMDRYAAFHSGATSKRIERAEAAVVRRADLIFATSPSLAERLDQLHDVVLVPNGVETAAFAVDRGAQPAWKTSAPVAGFYGTLGDWVDFDLLVDLARRRPQWSFVFAGPQVSREFDRLRKLANVRYLGVVGYDELARHAAWFDVGLVPFRLNALTRYVHPIKALEYLATGLPVASAPLPDLADYSGVIRFAKSSSEWLAAIDASLSGEARSADAVVRRRKAVAADDWDNRASVIVDHLKKGMRNLLPDQSADRGATVTPGGTRRFSNRELQFAA
ncbi:MAG TPA: glycosyltransferase [Pirellulales bacterium]|nr:glycosyltransferase [Pirellulales bacterium]